ncbi:ATP-binding protein [Streptomyces sp. IBSBF 2435]|uniref:ATP-binding protein n=1 Tax=Streptomyces sp. IBSBF 2435 TaxID=2903531 RepID=UPI002FDC2DE5
MMTGLAHRQAAAPQGAGRQVEVCVLRRAPTTLPDVRHWARVQFEAWHVPADALQEAELVFSELVSNVVLHGYGDVVSCRIEAGAADLHIEIREHVVREGAHTAAPPPDTRSDDEHGRGLLLVEALSSDWGVAPTLPGPDGCRRVWARIGLADR